MSIKIAPDSKVTIALGVILVSVAALVGTGWRAANALRDIKDELTEIKREVRAIHAQSWTVTDMDRWSRRLDFDNRERPILVPDPRDIHP